MSAPAAIPQPALVSDQLPLVPGAIGGRLEVGATPGKNTNRTLAIHPRDSRAIVGWTSWGARPAEAGDTGEVWVRAQHPSGDWMDAQTVNIAPVNAGVGGLGVTFALSDTLVAWGDGRSAILMATSADGGASWSPPAQIGTFAYQVISLQSDGAGGLHLLALTPDPHRLRYAYRAPSATTWAVSAIPFSGEQFGGELAVLDRADGSVRRFVVARLGGTVGLVRSDDGQTWMPIPVELGRFMSEPNPDKVSVLAASRPAGDLVAVAWSQYSAGGVFMQFSTDGGATWGREERVAQHQADGSCYDGGGQGLPCAYQPSLAYDATTDRLALVWVEVLRQHVPPMRLRLAWRNVDAQGSWRFAVTPTSSTVDTPPIVADWGWQGTIVSSGGQARHALLLLDERNDQRRVLVQPIVLAAWLQEGVS